MIYRCFETCLATLADVEAIDFFLARQLAEEYQQDSNVLFFHLLLALLFYTRQGHSCLPVYAVADRNLFSETVLTEPVFTDPIYTESSAITRAAEGSAPASKKPGYTFPNGQNIHLCLEFLGKLRHGEGPLVFEQGALYLRRYWQFECEVASALKPRLSFIPLQKSQLSSAQSIVASMFQQTQKIPGKDTSEGSDTSNPDWPTVAVANALGRQFSIVTGGPGTGKTYTATRLLIALQATFATDIPQKIIMAAPTGKAAQRLKEAVLSEKPRLRQQGLAAALIDSIPDNAMTLHRLLGFRPRSVQPIYGGQQKIDCDILLLDEVSMIDLPMLARLLRALPARTRLILLGDAEQLPSVEVGSILAELVGQKTVCYQREVANQIAAISGQIVVRQAERGVNDHVTRLIVSQRFGGDIKTLADLVIGGYGEDSWHTLTAKIRQKKADGDLSPQEKGFQHPQGEQLTLITGDTSAFGTWLKAICEHYFQALLQANSKEEAFAALKRFRILSPTRIGPRGVNRLNRLIESWLFQSTRVLLNGRHYKGQPLMVVENNDGVRLFNGDTGLVWPDDSTGKLMAWFEEEAPSEAASTGQIIDNKQYRALSLARLPAVETVYAMTIHKTQGSEFDHVAIVLPEQASRLLSRQLLYTGITRAKSHVYLVASKAIWVAAVNSKAERYSLLGARLASQD